MDYSCIQVLAFILAVPMHVDVMLCLCRVFYLHATHFTQSIMCGQDGLVDFYANVEGRWSHVEAVLNRLNDAANWRDVITEANQRLSAAAEQNADFFAAVFSNVGAAEGLHSKISISDQTW